MTMPRPITNEKGRTIATLYVPTVSEKKVIKNNEEVEKTLNELNIMKRELKSLIDSNNKN